MENVTIRLKAVQSGQAAVNGMAAQVQNDLIIIEIMMKMQCPIAAAGRDIIRQADDADPVAVRIARGEPFRLAAIIQGILQL